MKASMRYTIALLWFVLLSSSRAEAQIPAGTYNIPGHYGTLADAVTALNAAGIAGNVTINLMPGRAPEEVPAGGLRLGSAALNATLGSGRQLTIRGNGDTLVAYANTSGTATSMKGIFYLLGTDYVTIDSLHLVENEAANTNSNRQMHWGYVLLKLDGPVDGCNYVTIKNCTVALAAANTSVHVAAIYAGNHTVSPTVTSTAITPQLTPSGISGTHSNNVFSGNRLFGRKGIMMRGYAAPAGSRHLYDQSNQFTGNIVNFGANASYTAAGILLQNQQAVDIRNNEFGNISVAGAVMAGSTSSSYGIFLDVTPDGTATCTNNVFRLSNAGTGSICGIRSLFSGSGGNVVFDRNIFREWEFTGVSGNTDFFNSAMISQDAIVRRLYIRNNQIVNQTGLMKSGGLKGFMYKMPQTGYEPVRDTTDAEITDNVMDGFEQAGASGLGLVFVSAQINHINLYGKTVVSRNRAENITLNAGGFLGIECSPYWSSWGNSMDYEITDNVFNGIAGTGGTGFMSGTARNGLIRGNRFTNISMNGAGASIVGFSMGSNRSIYDGSGGMLAKEWPESNIFCYNNIMNNLHVTNSGATMAAKTVGIEALGGNSYIYNNVISNLSNEGRISGIESSWYDFQNYSWQTDRFHPKTYIYHNTIFIGGTSGFSGIEVSGIRVHLRNDTTDVRNNIIYLNAVSGTLNKVVAVMADYLHSRPGNSQVLDSVGSVGAAPHGGLNLNNNIYYLPPGPNNFYYAEGYSHSTNNATSLLRNGFGVSGVTENTAKNIVNDPGFNSQCSRYKAFIGNGRESATWWEQNLTPGTAAGTYLPAGPSFAKGTAATNMRIPATTDYAGAARGATPDIGAFQFTGSAPTNLPPVINITQRMPAITYCTDAASVGAHITAQNGVNTTTGTAPRLYYKKSSENNAFGNYPGQNNASFNGWKYVEAIGAAPNFTFNIDYSKLTSVVSAGDSVTYFVIAQDNAGTPNVAVNTAGFSNGCALPSVHIDPSVGSTTTTPVSYGYRILSLPVMTATAGQSEYCMNGTAYLKLTSLPAGAAPQWQERRGGGSFQDIPGADSIAYVSGNLIATTDYRAVIKCNGVEVAASNIVTVAISSAPAPSVTPGSRCGYGAVTLSAAAGTSDSLLWYEAATGGNPIHTGTSFTTPPLSAPKNYYVATYSNMLSGLHAGSVTPSPGSYNSNAALHGLKFDALNTFRLDSVTVYLVNGSAGDMYIKLLDAAGNELQRRTVPVLPLQLSTPAQYRPNQIHVGFVIPRGVDYQLVIDGPSGQVPTFWKGNAAFPAEKQGVVLIKEGVGVPTLWNYFFDWVVSIGCESMTRTPVNAMINPAPVVKISASDTAICNGRGAWLTATSGNAGYSYDWKPGVGIGGNVRYVTPVTTTTYYVLATDNTGGSFNGCANTDSIIITVHPSPISFFTATGGNNFCAGSDSVLMEAGVTASSYLWLRNGVGIPGATGTQYMAKDSGSYQLVMTDGICSDTSGVHMLDIYPIPQPVIVKNGDVLSTQQPYASYQWYWEGQAIPGATGATYTAIRDGAYTVRVKDVNNCEGISSPQQVTVGIHSISGAGSRIFIYPNPARSLIRVDAPFGVNVAICGIDGKVVLEQENAREIQLAHLADGIYMIRVTDQQGMLMRIEKLEKISF